VEQEHNRRRKEKTMRMFQRITFVLATVVPLALGACTTASTSGTVSAGGPSAYSAGATTATDAAVQSGASDNFATGVVLPPEPGFDPDAIVEAP